MTPDEKEIMALTIKSAMLEGFQEFATTMNAKISSDISTHKENCQHGGNCGNKNSLGDAVAAGIKDWRTITTGMSIVLLVIFAFVNAVKTLPKFTPEQVKQIAQQVQEVTNPTPVTKEK